MVTPGEPIDVLLPLSDMVEVRFSASDALHPSPLQICTVDNERMECSPEYRERVSRINTLQIKDGNASDSGNYTVRDSENNETIAVVQVHVRGERVNQHSRYRTVNKRDVWETVALNNEFDPESSFKQKQTGIKTVRAETVCVCVCVIGTHYPPNAGEFTQPTSHDGG